MIHNIIFDSVKSDKGEIVSLASGYVSLNQISFINEKITVNIEAKTGEIEFYDLESNKLLSAKMRTPTSGDEKFSEVKCLVEGTKIKLGFPEYTYKDNFPHCDGESDRWSKTISDFKFLCYDFEKNCLIK